MTIADLLKLIELSQVINTNNLKFDVTNEKSGRMEVISGSEKDLKPYLNCEIVRWWNGVNYWNQYIIEIAIKEV